jgi:Glycosyltransferases involved in cell wall biogenesis
MAKTYKVKNITISRYENNSVLSMMGTFYEKPANYTVQAFADGKEEKVISWCYPLDDGNEEVKFCFKVFWNNIPESFDVVKFVLCNEAGQKHELASYTKDSIDKKTVSSPIVYRIDQAVADEKLTTIYGFAYSMNHSVLTYQIYDENNREIPTSFHHMMQRQMVDHGVIAQEDIFCGFIVHFPSSIEHTYTLKILDHDDEQIVKLAPYTQSKKSLEKKSNSSVKSLYKRGVKYLKRNGIRKTAKRVLLGVGSDASYEATYYNTWFLRQRVSEKELERERQITFSYAPKISIIVPTFNTPANLLHEMIQSVIHQTYTNWELCIADGSSEGNEARDIILDYEKKDARIKVTLLNENYGISGNTNRALALVNGEYTSLFDHDDLLEPNALFEIVKALQDVQHDILYTDEDKLDEDSGLFKDPHFKSDYNPDLLLSSNYITHFFVVKTDIIKSVGGFDSAYDGSQDYDVILKCTEKAKSIYHIAMPLYHWRMHEGSTALNPESKMYCYESGRKAIQDHLKRVGIQAQVEMMPEPLYGMYHVTYAEPKDLVSVILLYDGRLTELKNSMNYLLGTNQYKNIEILLVDDGNGTDAYIKYVASLKVGQTSIKQISVKNTSIAAKYNEAAKYSKGKYLLYLEQSMIMTQGNAISEMASLCQRSDVGIVGGKILGKEHYIWHAGMIVGMDGCAVRSFTDVRHEIDWSYMVLDRMNCDYSAVSRACLMVKKDAYDQIGGFDESYSTGITAVDFCLKMRKFSKLVVYDAFSLWQIKPKPHKAFRYVEKEDKDINQFQQNWTSFMKQGDPYYNQNFDIQSKLYNLR